MGRAALVDRGIRARPLLGTVVAIRIEGASAAVIDAAMSAGFAAVERVHRLMSFHEPGSDVGRLNECAAEGAVKVDVLTFAVLSRALGIASSSGGCFDITVAPQLVERGLLPRPGSRGAPDPAANWKDIELLDDQCVRFGRPLWIDLGGIAKGFAVDCALGQMALPPDSRVCINAGGDLRVAGPGFTEVRLRCSDPGAVPVMRLQDASLASSSGRERGKRHDEWHRTPHVHGIRRIPMGRHTFVSVVAGECMVADALTKVVMALEERSEQILAEFGATAYLMTEARGWRTLGAGT